jgi:hypothetical protein
MPPEADNPRLHTDFLSDRACAATLSRQKHNPGPFQIPLQRHRRTAASFQYLAIFPRNPHFSCFGNHPDLESRLTFHGKRVLAWRQIAGPKLSRSQLQCALVGAQEVAAENHQKNRAGWPKHNAQALLQPHHPPINIVGGYKFSNAPDVKLREEKEPGFALTASSTAPDDNLDIPDFLKR